MEQFSIEFLKSLPKAELHCHLDGSMRVSTILDIAKARNVSLPHNDEASLGEYLKAGDSCKDLVDYLKAFAVTVAVLQDRASIIRAVCELAEDSSEENIRYLEIRYCPTLSTQEALSTEDATLAMIEGKEAAEKMCNITIGLILCALRHNTQEEATELALLSIKYKDSGVVAYDLAGPENNYPCTLFSSQFAQVRDAKQHITIHAGEACGANSIAEAIQMGAGRIGHGTSLIEDPTLTAQILQQGIPIEICLSSNVQTQAVPHASRHPIKHFLEQGIMLSINTDNRLISDTSLSKEYKIVCDTFQISKRELYTIVINGFKSAFIPQKEKDALIEDVVKELRALGLQPAPRACPERINKQA